MKKKYLMFLLALSMVLNMANVSYAGESQVFGEKANVASEGLEEIIEEFKGYYLQENKEKYNYLEVMTLRSLDVADEKIQKKITIDDISEEYAQIIMGIVGAGLDPAAYNGKNYIELLVQSQIEDKKTDAIAHSIIALDLAGAEYDVLEVVKTLESKFTIRGNKAFIKKWSWDSDGDLDLTAISLIALSNHKEIIDKDLITKIVNYIEAERRSSGMYGTGSWGPVSGRLTSKMVQALVAADVEIPEKTINALLGLRENKKFREDENSGDATAEVFAALTDVYTKRSMYRQDNKDIGDPVRVEIILPGDTNLIKVGKEIQLLGKSYDDNDAYNPFQTYRWSSDDSNIATVDTNTGKLRGLNTGTVNIRVQIQGFSNIEAVAQIRIVEVEPDSIEILIDENLAEIEVGRKTGITADVRDMDKEIVEGVDVQWEINPLSSGKLDESGIFTALETGDVTITASVEKENGEILSNTIDLCVINKETIIGEALEEVKDGLIKNSGKYDNTTAMGLKLMGIDQDHIVGKVKKYTQYSSNANTRAKDIMVATIIGKDPRDYDGRDYVQELIDNNFYDEKNVEWLSNSMIALDMAEAEYDYIKAINALKSKLTKESDKYYAKYTNGNTDNKNTALILIALSNHTERDGVAEIINGIRNHFKSEQNENALIQNCESHSYVIQSLIASGEDIYSDEWTKLDKYGNKVTMLDALLSMKVDEKFKVNPAIQWPKDGQEVFAFAALSDLSRNGSMYHEFNESRPKDFTIEIQEESKNLIINQGEEVELKAQVLEDGNPVSHKVVWESADANIAKTKDGKIKGVNIGQTKIKARVEFFEDIYDETNVTVNQMIGDPTSVMIEHLKNIPIKKEDSFQLKANVFDGNGNKLENNLLEWESKNPEIISITEDGSAIAHEAGSVKIIVKIRGTEIEDVITISVFADEDEANNTINRFIDRIEKYYETIHFVENQSSLNAWETATFTKAGFSLDKWSASKDYEVRYDQNLKYLGNKANQVLIMLDLGEDPANYKGRNLIEEIVNEINKSDYGYGQQNYLRAVRAVDRFNETYKDQKIDYDEGIVVHNILLAQTVEGGFKERGDDPVPLNTGYALNALSAHKSFNGVEESINEALDYLQLVQKEDGGFYMSKYQTGNNTEIISGLLSVGEDLTSDEWTKGNMNPIESMFMHWDDRGSFNDAEDDSINNRAWITATQKSLYTLVDLQAAGYSNYVVKSRVISDLPDIQEETLDVKTAIAVPDNVGYELKSKPQQVTINNKYHSGALTALGALQATTTLYEMMGSTVTSIYGIENKGVGGWMYTVNDEMPNVGASEKNLEEGDRIIWFYSPQGMEGSIPTWRELTGEISEEKLTIEILFNDNEIEVGKERILDTKVKKGTEVLDNSEIIWSSTNEDIATIDQGGKIVGRKEGSVSINASLKNHLDIVATIQLRVVKNNNSDFEIKAVASENLIRGRHKKLIYKVMNLTNQTKKTAFSIELYNAKTNKIVSSSKIEKEFSPKEEIEIEAIFLIPVKGEYYIKKYISKTNPRL